jgi:hypothetical protein
MSIGLESIGVSGEVRRVSSCDQSERADVDGLGRLNGSLVRAG